MFDVMNTDELGGSEFKSQDMVFRSDKGVGSS